MSELPESWSSASIPELSMIIRGVTYSRNDAHDQPGNGLIPILRANNITERGLVFDDLVYVPMKLVSAEQVIRANDLIVAISSGSISVVGKAKQTRSDIDAGFGAFCAAIRPFDSIEPRYFGHFFSSNYYRSTISSLARGVNINNLKREHFEQIEIPLAPLSEQKRIADKLDRLLGRVDACQAHLERVPEILKRFRQSVLAAAMSGRLTEEWREKQSFQNDGKLLVEKLQSTHEGAGGYKVGNAAEPTEGVHNLNANMFPDSWEIAELREMVRPDRPITYGILKPGPDLPEGIPYIRVADYPNDRLSLGNVRKTSPVIDKEFSRSRLEAGDILLSIRGTVGRLIVIPRELENANITQDSARLSIQSCLNRDFVLWYLRSDFAQSRMRKSIKGVAVRGINIGDVRALQVPIPALSEQNEIVRRVESLFAFADRFEMRWQVAQKSMAMLTPSLLAKAFRGELVEQDAKDEPAEKLLERIRLQRATQAVDRPRRQPQTQKTRETQMTEEQERWL
jgi:type I restriction enzyme, S subunit